MVEICTFSLESSLIAQKGGATRIELCGGFAEGGTTPSAGLIKKVRDALAIDVYVMIRPRGGDFCYSDSEFEVMKEDIQLAKTFGANGVVFGLLLPDGTIDIERTKALVVLAQPMGVTFHRAFDMCQEPFQALEAIISCGCERILTSGQQKTAIEGIDLLKSLVEKSGGRIEIMAGSGVSEQNVRDLLKTGVHAVHLTAKSSYESPMTYKNSAVSMASFSLEEYERYETDIEKCRAVVAIVQNV